MGRGRQKAKQTKVARRLKYESPEMDIEALQRELSGQGEPEQWDDDPYAKYAQYDSDDSADSETPSGWADYDGK